MGWLKGLIGGGKRSIADVEAALSRLADERALACEAVDKARKRHDELLLVDGSDSKIAEADAAADKARLTIERCDRAEPLLLAELTALKDEAKQALELSDAERHLAAAQDLRDALGPMLAKRRVMLMIDAETRDHGFEPRTRTFAVPPAGLNEQVFNLFEAALDKERDALETMRTATPKPPAAATPKPPAAKPILKAVQAPPPAPKPPPRAPVRETPGEGQTLVVVVRSGLEAKGAQWRNGDTIAVSSAEAEALMRAGAATLADGQPLTWGAA